YACIDAIDVVSDDPHHPLSSHKRPLHKPKTRKLSISTLVRIIARSPDIAVFDAFDQGLWIELVVAGRYAKQIGRLGFNADVFQNYGFAVGAAPLDGEMQNRVDDGRFFGRFALPFVPAGGIRDFRRRLPLGAGVARFNTNEDARQWRRLLCIDV